MKDKSNKAGHKKKVVATKAGDIPFDKVTAIMLAIILLITLVIYLPSLNNKFTNWDDPFYVINNKMITHPEDISQMITTPVVGNYHPLTMYSLALDHKIAEGAVDEEKAKVYHITNLILHLLNIILVFYFLMLLSDRRKWMSLTSALLFAIHPMHVESVAWISERKDLLYTFFFMLSLISYLRYLDQKELKWIAACLICFILSLSSKPAAVILPLVLIIIDLFKKRKLDTKTINEKIPFFILSLVVGILTYIAQSKLGALANRQSDPFIYKLIYGSYALLLYFFKFLFPFRLSAVYPYPNATGQSLSYIYYLAPIVVAVLTGGLIYFSKKNKVVLFGLAFFVINVILVLQIVTVGNSIIFDRYSYVSYIGLFMIMTWWLDMDSASLNSNWKNITYALPITLGILICIYIPLTASRIKVWNNSETLWTNVINQFPDDVPAAYDNRGYYYKSTRDFPKAIADFNKAISLDTSDGSIYNKRGNVFFDMGKFDLAISDYDRAIKLSPNLWKAFLSRAGAKANTGDLKGAMADVTIAIKNEPDNAKAFANRGMINMRLNDPENALRDYQTSITLDPQNDRLYNDLGRLYQSLGKYNESLTAFNNAITLSPSTKQYYETRAQSWSALGNNENAQADMRTAQQLK